MVIMKGLCPLILRQNHMLIRYRSFESNESQFMYYLSAASGSKKQVIASNIFLVPHSLALFVCKELKQLIVKRNNCQPLNAGQTAVPFVLGRPGYWSSWHVIGAQPGGCGFCSIKLLDKKTNQQHYLLNITKCFNGTHITIWMVDQSSLKITHHSP